MLPASADEPSQNRWLGTRAPKKATERQAETSGAREMREPRWRELASEALIVNDEATDPILSSPTRW